MNGREPEAVRLSVVPEGKTVKVRELLTTGSMRRGQAHMWENVARVERGERPDCVVNGL